jgi:Uma2 family endonuclease
MRHDHFMLATYHKSRSFAPAAHAKKKQIPRAFGARDDIVARLREVRRKGRACCHPERSGNGFRGAAPVDLPLMNTVQHAVAMPAEPAYVPAMSPSAALMTADELLRANIPNKRTELVRGVLRVREPAGFLHGRVAMNLGAELRAHVKQTDAGAVLAAETGFKLFTDPDTVRAPDVAFVAKGREPPPDARGFADVAPDLVVEVLSADDRSGEVLAKVADWLSAGTRLVWVVDPARRVTRVYRQDGSETIVAADGTLDGEDVLPGFACPFASIL